MQGRVKLVHILLESIIIILSFLVFFPLSKNTEHFDQNCLLNADLYVTRFSNDSVSLDLASTVFGDIDDCNYTTFFNVVVFLHGLTWIWFFFHLDKLTTRDGSSANLLLPALITHLVLFICAIVSSVMIGDGFTSWCDNIEGNTNDAYLQRLSCEDYESLSWTVDRASFYTYNQMALISSWIMVAFILISMVMTCVHLYWDFLATFYKKPVKDKMETSGFVDNGVGILNKMAMSYSGEGFYTDSLEGESYEIGGAAGGASAGAVAPSAVSGAGDTRSNTSKGDRNSHKEMIVNATIHTPEDSPTKEMGASDSGSELRSRGNAVSKD